MGYSEYQVLTIASMIEREAGKDDDRSQIARVIYNRLYFKMPLQIDATLFYGQDPKTPFDQLKAIDTPYNTYLHDGPAAHADRQSRRGQHQGGAEPGAQPRGVPHQPGGRAVRAALLRVADQGQARLLHQPARLRGQRGRAPRPPVCWAEVISGGTRIAAVIGAPVRHSLSPVIHNAAFAALGLDWVYVAFEVPDGHAETALAAMSALGIDGLNVTMPHKAAVAAAVDVRSVTAERLGAVNTVVRRADGTLEGHNTDGIGFVDSLINVGIDPAGRRVVVLGAGGAARAVILALADAGAAEVAVVNRSHANAEVAAALAGAVGRVGVDHDIDDADIIVHATPVGMGDNGGLPLDPKRLRAGQVVADLVYHPLETPLLLSARTVGAAGVDGLGMLIHQAAHAQQLWTGMAPPVAAIRVAARRHLALPPRSDRR